LLLWVENQWHLSKLLEHFGGNSAARTSGSAGISAGRWRLFCARS